MGMKCCTISGSGSGKGGGKPKLRHCSPKQKKKMPQICSNVKRSKRHTKRRR